MDAKLISWLVYTEFMLDNKKQRFNDEHHTGIIHSAALFCKNILNWMNNLIDFYPISSVFAILQ